MKELKSLSTAVLLMSLLTFPQLGACQGKVKEMVRSEDGKNWSAVVPWQFYLPDATPIVRVYDSTGRATPYYHEDFWRLDPIIQLHIREAKEGWEEKINIFLEMLRGRRPRNYHDRPVLSREMLFVLGKAEKAQAVEVVDELNRWLGRETDPEVKIEIMSTLKALSINARLPDNAILSIVAALKGQLTERDPTVNSCAAFHLAELGEGEANLRVLLPIFNSQPGQRVRIFALLAGAKSSKADSLASVMLNSSNVLHQLAVWNIKGWQGDTTTAPLKLKEALASSPDVEVRSYAAMYLGFLGRKFERDALRAALAREREEKVIQSIQYGLKSALNRCGCPE